MVHPFWEEGKPPGALQTMSVESIITACSHASGNPNPTLTLTLNLTLRGHDEHASELRRGKDQGTGSYASGQRRGGG